MRGFKVLILAAMFFSSIDIYAQFAGGSGTEEDPYLVETAVQLDSIRNHANAYFKQIADIDLNVAPYNTGEGWDPIGTSYSTIDFNIFYGVYDGGEYEIRNLYINRPSGSCIGLFGNAVADKKTGLLNIKIIDCNVTGETYVGGLAGNSSTRINKSSCTGI